MLDFSAIKRIPLTDVCARYGVALTFGGTYARARCPLPGHGSGDKDKNFNIHLQANYWKCWSESCNEKAGCKGGDVINFVALMDKCSQHDAAKKLSAWFHIADEKAAPPIEKRPDVKAEKQPSQGTESTIPSPSEEDKSGYLHAVGLLMDNILKRGDKEDESAYLKRVRKAVMKQIYQSYKNGKLEGQGLPAKS